METGIDMVRGDPLGYKAQYMQFVDASATNVFNTQSYGARDPLLGELELQQAARFQADQFVNVCPQVNVSHNSCDGTSFFVRVDGFYSRGSPTGEIAAPDFWTDPLDIVSLWICDGVCEATDGCIVEPDGICPHGHPSWLLRIGII